MQNENGPCPLLAICNALLLKGEMFIHPDQSFVSLDELLTQLSVVILKHKPSTFSSKGEQTNYEENIAATMATFNELSRGLDVNVRYSSVFGFEFTVQNAIFDLVGVPLCHGWLPDPTDEACSLVKFSSYNQLTVMIIKGSEELEKMTAKLEQAEAEPLPSSSSSSSAPASSSAPSSDTNADFAATSSSAPSSVDEEVVSEEAILAIKHGQMIRKWMEDTASQLTFHGITKLYEELKEGQLYVFFRNNHFSTIYMHEASLWVLITDQGYTKQVAVWEKLDSVHGDSFFVTSEFQPYTGTADDYVALPDVENLVMEQSVPNYQDSATSLDEQLARQLQEAENRRAAEGSPAQSAQRPPPKRAKLTQSQQPADTRGSNGPKRPLNQSAPGGPRVAKSASSSAAAKRGASSGNPKSKGGEKDDDCVIL
jgi:hypothetical protein